MQFLPVFFIIIAVVLPPVSSTQLEIHHPDYDYDFQKSSKDLNSTVSKVSARSQSSPQFLSFDRGTYLAASLPRSSLFDLTFEKFENSARLESFPWIGLADLETHQNSAQAESSPSFRPAPETNQKHLNCDCYQMSAQPRSSSSFSASLETLQKQLNYEFQNVVLLRQAMTHSSYSLENNKEFSILGERLIETTVSLRLSTKDLEISLKDLNDKMSEVLKVDTSCAADGTRLGLHNIVRVSSSTDSSTSSIVCDAFRAIIWAIALDSRKCDDAHNVFWAVHGGDGKAI
ncbi:ribonuclease III domain-containing protein [Artemisia annua]|uniref:Ribonuclease III domain-containing protein n=1 Tax=Artemisia annua TaxID=35608 RepID=A0A2U1LZQ3_ARTAN|nr:ribonuclease III domain-containing protein [Artemisia annua]